MCIRFVDIEVIGGLSLGSQRGARGSAGEKGGGEEGGVLESLDECVCRE